MRKTLLSFIAIFLIFQTDKAQVVYSVSSIPYAPLAYSTGTILPTGLLDDMYSAVMPIGFTFNFFGTDYNNLVIGSNGIVSFDTAKAGSFCAWSLTDTIPTAVATDMRNAIMCPYHDINPASSSSNHIAYFSFGTAPYRRFVINFYNVPMFSCTSLTNTGQVILYETSNNIDINIENKPVCSGWNGGRATEGIENSAGTTAYVIPGRNASVWTTTNESYRFCYNGVCEVAGDSTAVVLRGKAYYDWNNNCIYDSLTDVAAPYQYITNDTGYVMAMTDIDGNYELIGDTGYRVVTIDTSAYFTVQCPSPGVYPLHLTAAPDTIAHLNFGDTAFHCLSPELGIYSWGLKTCDTVTLSTIAISYYNPSPLSQFNANLILHLNDSMRINASCSYAFSTLGGNDYAVTIPDTILPFQHQLIIIPINTGCDTIGTLYSYSAELISDNLCGTYRDTAYNTTALSAAIDPNDKMVRRFGAMGQSFEAIQDVDSLATLEYVINFQNNGSAPASFIRIKDVLSTKLVAGTIRLISSSFPCYMTISGNEITFNFDNINLPNGTIDDPTTHGYVIFKVTQVNGHRQGTEIENVASIFFDNAPAVVTNTAIARIPYTCYGSLNPMITTVSCFNQTDGRIAIHPTSLYAVPSYTWSTGASTPDIEDLSAGTYSVTVNDSLSCSYYQTFNLANPTEIIVNIATTKDSACNGDLISLTASGADAYTWEDFSVSSPFLNNYLAGTTTFTVVGYDTHSCSDTASITVYLKNCTVGIDEIDVKGIHLFPSQTNSIFNIQIEDAPIESIDILSMDGKLVKTAPIVSNSGSLQVSVQDISKGLYFVKVLAGGHLYYGKVIKE
jgi:hypothetical protein